MALVRTPFGIMPIALDALEPEARALAEQNLVDVPEGAPPPLLGPAGLAAGGTGLAGLAGGAVRSAVPGAADPSTPGQFDPEAATARLRGVGRAILNPVGTIANALTPSAESAVEGARTVGRGALETAIGQSLPPRTQQPLQGIYGALQPRGGQPDAAPAPAAATDAAGGVPGLVQDAASGSVEMPIRMAPAAPARPAIPIGAPGTMREIAKGTELQQRGIATQQAAAAQLGADTAGVLDETTAKRRAVEERSAEKQAALEVKKAEALAEYEQIQQQAKEHTIDPNRVFKNMDTGQKITAGLGLVLGSIGAALTKSTNLAAQAIENAIDRDVAAQRAEYEKLRDSAAEARTWYGVYRQAGFDEAEAAAAAKASLAEEAQLRIQSFAAQASIPEAQGKAMQLAGEVGIRGATLKENLVNQRAQTAMARETLGLKREEMAYRREEAERQRLMADPDPLYVPGTVSPSGGPGRAPRPEEADKARAAMATYEALQRRISEALALRRAKGAEVLDRKAVAEGRAIAGDLVGFAKELFDLGVLQPGDMTFVEKVVPENITDIGFVGTQLEQLERISRSRTEAKLRSMNLIPVWGSSVDEMGFSEAPKR